MLNFYEVMTKPFEHEKILGTADPVKDVNGNDLLMLYMPREATAFATVLIKGDAIIVEAYAQKVFFGGLDLLLVSV